MGIHLKDIIDLEFLVSRDEAIESREDINNLVHRDREIYSQISGDEITGKALLFAWLDQRKKQLQDSNNKKTVLLPGALFSMIYRCVAVMMIVIGVLSGITLAGAFLVYHGVQPVNVTVFFVMFTAVPFLLSVAALVFGFKSLVVKEGKQPGTTFSFFYMLISFLFFNIAPRIFQKIHYGPLKHKLKDLEYAGMFLEIKKIQYRELFFWPFSILTSLFAGAFSSGAIGVTFFKVLVSDMAFGWQSTLVSTSAAVHKLVSFVSMPWAVFMPESLSSLVHPSLEQIEGSRIVLKEGIFVLATSDLASWWPFLCFSIFVYALLPRLFLVLSGIWIQKRKLACFDFERPAFRELIIRMTSPVLDIESNGEEVETEDEKEADSESSVQESIESEVCADKGVLLFPEGIFPEKQIIQIQTTVEKIYGVKAERFPVSMEIDTDLETLKDRAATLAGPVMFAYEAWQAPIRGILYYISMIQDGIGPKRSLWVMLTNEAGSNNIFLSDNDKDMEIWKNAVLKFKNPNLLVRGVFEP